MNYMNCAKLRIHSKTAKEARYEASKDESKIIQEYLSKRVRGAPEEQPDPTHAGGLADLMPCFHPLKAWRARGGGITFTQGDAWSDRPLEIPCAQCTGCQIEKVRQWGLRLMHEQQTHDRSSFITLTYNEESLPENRSLNIRTWQLFAKKLRKRIGPFRYFHCGEYTDKMRPHYHAAIFGLDFSGDRRVFENDRKKPYMLYTSPLLEDVWGKGYATVGELNYDSATYIARYCMKKITPGITDESRKAHEEKYQYVIPRTGEVTMRKPEYISMSRRPGIGQDWFKKYREDVYPEDEVIFKGRKFRPPRYYDKQLEEEELKGYKYKRARNALEKAEELTPDRLETRENILEIKERERELRRE